MILSTRARAMTLRAHFGDTKTSDALSTLYFALFKGNPAGGGVEPTSTGGYARIAKTNDSALWGTISLSTVQIQNQVLLAWPAATALWSITDPMDYYAIFDAATAGNLIYADLLGNLAQVTAVGDQPRVLAGGLTISQLSG